MTAKSRIDVATDPDPQETQEWLEAVDAVLDGGGRQRCEELLSRVIEHARQHGIALRGLLNTPYCNSIPVSEQPTYPGHLEIEQRLTAIIRWNAVAMVVRANRKSAELGGHLASYASAADLFEVGFHQ